MPKSATTCYQYEFTLTFKSHYDIDDKRKKLALFPEEVSKFLVHSGNSEYWLSQAVEYHKTKSLDEDVISNEDDHEAPHSHGIIYSSRKLGYSRFRAILDWMNDFYGRSEFRLMTAKRISYWSIYHKKDVEKNEKLLGFSHHVYCRLEPPLVDQVIETNMGTLADNLSFLLMDEQTNIPSNLSRSVFNYLI